MSKLDYVDLVIDTPKVASFNFHYDPHEYQPGELVNQEHLQVSCNFQGINIFITSVLKMKIKIKAF